MLILYRGLEKTVVSTTASGTEKAKCAEVAANIAIDVLKMESEGIKIVKELVAKKNSPPLNNLRSFSINHNNNNTQYEFNKLDIDNDNRKF
jgi:hypothetical protein